MVTKRVVKLTMEQQELLITETMSNCVSEFTSKNANMEMHISACVITRLVESGPNNFFRISSQLGYLYCLGNVFQGRGRNHYCIIQP